MRCFVSLVLSLSIAACGGSDAECVIDTDCPLFSRCEANACVPLGGLDSGGRDGGGRDGGGADGGADGGPAPARGVGNVTISQTPGVAPTHSMRAVFVNAPDTTCTKTTMGSCVTTDCPIAMPSMDDGGVMVDAGAPTLPHAGTISLVGGTMPLSIAPDTSGLYTPITGTGSIFAGAAALTIMATGGDVSAFAQMTTAPGDITVTSPSFLATVTVDRSVDFALAWTATAPTPGQVQAQIGGSDATHSIAISCTFDPTTLSGTIPSAVLAALPMGSGYISVGVRAGTTMPAGSYDVTVQVTTAATADTGAAASGATMVP